LPLQDVQPANPNRLVHVDPVFDQPTLMQQALVKALKQQQTPTR